jgi:diphthamide biosynthesis protein 7
MFPSQRNINVHVGGDDLKMKAWDIRQGFLSPIFVNKHFEAGVTTIQSHPFVEHLVAVGRLGSSNPSPAYVLCFISAA